MHNDYSDIRDRIPEPPRWWDEDAVPRYCDFTPKETANIYADEAALVLIGCQNCGAKFKVCFSSSRSWRMIEKHRGREVPSIADRIRDSSIHYGDPPNAGCCASGPTMNCDDLYVVEYWTRDNQKHEWERDASLEIGLADYERLRSGADVERLGC